MSEMYIKKFQQLEEEGRRGGDRDDKTELVKPVEARWSPYTTFSLLCKFESFHNKKLK